MTHYSSLISFDKYEDFDELRVFFLGPDHAGNILEVIGQIQKDNTLLIFHAMPIRAKYLELFKKERRQ